MFAGETPVTHSFAYRLIQIGYAGILVRSFAHGAAESDRNLVLWRYGSNLPTQVTLVEDEV